MSNRFVRSSKYRHVFGKAEKRENSYDNVKVAKSAWDSNKIKVNRLHLAVCWEAGGGGAAAVIPLTQTGKLPSDFPRVAGHSAAVLDVDWAPHNDNILATTSEDATVKIWDIPETGLTENLTEAVQVLKGHRRKVGTANFHPTASNILATTSTDYTVQIWDIEKGESKTQLKGWGDIIQCFDWNYDGSKFVTTSKDKKIRIGDPRIGTFETEITGHAGVKGSRAVWIGNTGKFCTIGFSRMSERQFFIWDTKNLEKPVAKQNIDTSSGILMPFFDADTSMLYLAGKGDGNIRYYEIVDDDKQFYFISEFKSAQPQRGMAALPKVACDVAKCEVTRLYKVGNSIVEPISFTVPRKSDLFQDDIFPDTPGQKPALTADEWWGGKNADPILVNLEEAYVPPEKPKVEFQKKDEAEDTELSEKELRAEYEKLVNRVAYLEAEVAKKDAIIKDLKA